MSVEAMSAQGTRVYIQPAGAGPFFELGELRDLTPPAITRNAIETTSHNNLEETFVPGIRRKTEMTMTLGYVPGGGVETNHDLLETSIIAGSCDIWKVVYPNAAEWLFSGYLINLGPSCPVDDGLTADATVRPTGAHTINNPA